MNVLQNNIKIGDLICSKWTSYSKCIVLSIYYNDYSAVCYLFEKNKIVQELIVDYEWTKINV